MSPQPRNLATPFKNKQCGKKTTFWLSPGGIHFRLQRRTLKRQSLTWRERFIQILPTSRLGWVMLVLLLKQSYECRHHSSALESESEMGHWQILLTGTTNSCVTSVEASSFADLPNFCWPGRLVAGNMKAWPSFERRHCEHQSGGPRESIPAACA